MILPSEEDGMPQIRQQLRSSSHFRHPFETAVRKPDTDVAVLRRLAAKALSTDQPFVIECCFSNRFGTRNRHDDFLFARVHVEKNGFNPRMLARAFVWIGVGEEQPIVMLCEARIEAGTNNQFLVRVQIENTNLLGFNPRLSDVAHVSPVRRERLDVVVVRPMTNCRFKCQTPNTVIPSGD